jgi:hypothetical protein
MRRILGVSSPWVLIMMASGLDEGVMSVMGHPGVRILVKMQGSVLRGSIGASLSVHLGAEPRSAITRLPPILPLEIALRRILPV